MDEQGRDDGNLLEMWDRVRDRKVGGRWRDTSDIVSVPDSMALCVCASRGGPSSGLG